MWKMSYERSWVLRQKAKKSTAGTKKHATALMRYTGRPLGAREQWNWQQKTQTEAKI